MVWCRLVIVETGRCKQIQENFRDKTNSVLEEVRGRDDSQLSSLGTAIEEGGRRTDLGEILGFLF